MVPAIEQSVYELANKCSYMGVATAHDLMCSLSKLVNSLSDEEFERLIYTMRERKAGRMPMSRPPVKARKLYR